MEPLRKCDNICRESSRIGFSSINILSSFSQSILFFNNQPPVKSYWPEKCLLCSFHICCLNISQYVLFLLLCSMLCIQRFPWWPIPMGLIHFTQSSLFSNFLLSFLSSFLFIIHENSLAPWQMLGAAIRMEGMERANMFQCFEWEADLWNTFGEIFHASKQFYLRHWLLQITFKAK